MKKVIQEEEDFNKILNYITTQTIRFQDAPKAVEIMEILKRAKIAEVEEKTIEHPTIDIKRTE
jgi:hypothetical protein